MRDERVGVIGLGNMGGRMARRIVESGRTVLGYDVDRSRVADAGAAEAASVAEVAADADCVLLSLPDSRVVEAVTRGDGGLLEHCRAGQVIVDLSTSAPRSTVSIAAAFLEQQVEYVDAGISGGAAAAERGALTIMAGGRKEVIEQISWLFEPIASRVYFMGKSGSGHTAKLLNNYLNGMSLAATAEVMVGARKAGLDLKVLLEVLNHSSGVNFATLNRFPKIVEGDYLEGGLTSKLMMKDLVAYLDCTHELGVPPLCAAGPIAAFGLAENLGYGDLISNRVVDAIGDVSGGVRLFGTGEETA